MDVVTYAAAVRKAKKIIDYEIEHLPPATTEHIGGVIIGSNLTVTNDGVVSVNTAGDAIKDDTRPITSGGTFDRLSNIYDMTSVIMECINRTTGTMLLVRGMATGSSGTSDVGYNQIALAVAGEAATLGEYTVGLDVLKGYDGAKYVYLILTVMNENGLDRDNLMLGTLYQLDNVEKKAYFAIGHDIAVIDAARNITLIEG